MKKLSKQQQAVLDYLRERHEAGAEHVLFAELLGHLNGWDLVTEHVRRRLDGSTYSEPSWAQFDVAAIGEATYATARASLTRTLRRLESRGLVRRGVVDVPGSYGRTFERAAVALAEPPPVAVEDPTVEQPGDPDPESEVESHGR